MIRLRLYTTLGCHLCEQMQALVTTLSCVDIVFEPVEISADEALMQRYGTRIPVLLDGADDSAQEALEGRVGADDVADWLAGKGWLDRSALEAFSRSPGVRETPGARLVAGRRVLGQKG
ncbi:glutaredoxin family protein [Halomonas sp. V046]|uniref:glutaredoxin family protein n=1 Tax=Halomonas sp. V046 TaxID=3459611 RepID=UPI0040450FE0